MDANSELLGAIGRIRRAMPRNSDAMLICDAAEKSIQKQTLPEGYEVTAKFDKKAYQRELMRKRRAAGKAK
jgi:hypothetical protein